MIDTVNRKLNAQALSCYLPFISLMVLFILNILIFFPGQMTPDSTSQYKEAFSNVYNDVHPPMMSWMWRLLLHIFPGTSGIFVLHLILLYSACLLFILAFKKSSITWYYVFLPFFPPIVLYSSMIWKDVGFACSYLVVAAAITYCVQRNKQLHLLQLCSVLIILFYGTAVKYQAIFIAPLMLLALAYIMNNFKMSIKKACLYLPLFYMLSIISVQQFNALFISPDKKSNWWRFVKIYDLAGISLDQNKPIFPDYIKRYKNFSMEHLKEKFNYERVDDIAFFADSPIPGAASADELNDLLNTWYAAVMQHPLSYLKHRFNNWKTILWAKPLQKINTLNFSEYKGLRWFAALQKAKDSNDTSITSIIGEAVFGVLTITRHLFSFIVIFIIMLLQLMIGCLTMKNNKFAALLVMMNGAALLLVALLFALSMASSLRYVYMSVCMVYASLPITYYMYTTKR